MIAGPRRLGASGSGVPAAEIARHALPLLVLAAGIALAAPLAPPAPVFAGGTTSPRILDPYAGGSGDWYRGQLHMHSTTHQTLAVPDSVREKVEFYRDAGYDFVSVTDHNFRPPPLSIGTIRLPTHDPGVPGILFISGAEIGFLMPADGRFPGRSPHIGGFGMGGTISRGDSLFHLSMGDRATIQAAVDSIHTMIGVDGKPALAVLNHPEMRARGDSRYYPADFRTLSGCAGIEVYNTKWAFTSPSDRAWQHLGTSHWDWMLDHADEPRWGFATDDAHHYVIGKDYLGGWVLVQAEERTAPAILEAIRAGRFVACVDYCAGATRDTTSAEFTRLGAEGGAIVAASDRPTEFTWWTDAGHLTRRTEGVTSDRYEIEGWERWVRVRIRNSAGAAYSQPFRVVEPARDEERWKLRREDATRVLIHFDEGEGPVADDASGRGNPLLLDWRPPSPTDERVDAADSLVFRDVGWEGWVPNGVGTVPDETDLDRDRSGYAVRAHGRTLRGEIVVREGSPFLGSDPVTIEWIGAVERRTGDEQPLFVNETIDADGRRRGWRIVATEAGAAGLYRFRWYLADGRAQDVSFGVGVEIGAVELAGVSMGPTGDGRGEIRAAVGEAAPAIEGFPLREIAFREHPEPPVAVFFDPHREGAEVFHRLRELRVTAGVRTEEARIADGRRLGLGPASASP